VGSDTKYSEFNDLIMLLPRVQGGVKHK